MRRLVSVAAVAGAVLMVGCAQVPQQEIDSAKAAIDAAKAAEAPVYVAEKYAAAEKALASAMAEVEKQKAAFALSRNYTQAKQLLTAATQQAQEAQKAAADAKAAVKAEAEGLVATVQNAVAEAKKLLEKAPKGKDGKQALEAIGTELTAVESAVAAAQTKLQQGAFAAARDELTASKGKVESITAELQNAIEKAKGKKK